MNTSAPLADSRIGRESVDDSKSPILNGCASAIYATLCSTEPMESRGAGVNNGVSERTTLRWDRF